MVLELQCPCCQSTVTLPAFTDYEETIKPGTAISPWDVLALGDGETCEDRLHTWIQEQGAIRCPECAALCPVEEENLGEWTMELLSSW